ncbi:MAG: hypothetical protein QM763_23560 [Agriterribacter sp.]
MKKSFALSLAILFWHCTSLYSQVNRVDSFEVRLNDYLLNLSKLENLLEIDGQFAQGVFIVEEFQSQQEMELNDFERKINSLTDFIIEQYNTNSLKKYRQPDSINYLKNLTLFKMIFDSVLVNSNASSKTKLISFSYYNDDAIGKANALVVDLLETGKGDCHSLSYLYKIIADKIGAKCWFALAPNHIYIKNFSEQYGWYNTELTSRSFPSDAWIMASGYISADAIRSKIYMDTLSNQQSIGLCVLDLAKAYEYETKNYYDGFILKCCDLVLEYHATNPMALLLKAETLKKVYLKQKNENAPTARQAYDDMEAAYITLAKLHYREMPKEMYDKWVKQIQHSSGQPK